MAARGPDVTAARALAVFAPLAWLAVAFACGGATVARDEPSDASSPPEAGVVEDAPVLPVARGERVLAIGLDPLTQTYPSDLAAARDAGVGAEALAFGWDEIEVAVSDAGADAATTTLFQPALHVANLVLGDQRAGAIVSVLAVDRGGARMPVDLAGRPLSDPEVIRRYLRAIDYARDQLRDTPIGALFVASDVDARVDDPAFRAAFAVFLNAVVAHVSATDPPRLPVGFASGLRGAIDHAATLAPLWVASGIVGIDLAADPPCVVVDPERLASDVAAAVAAAPRPVVFREVGYPSAACGGTPERQAAFVQDFFAAWDVHAARIPFAAFARLDDLDADRAERRATRAALGPEGAAYFASTGLRTTARAPKPALGALVRATGERPGWR